MVYGIIIAMIDKGHYNDIKLNKQHHLRDRGQIQDTGVDKTVPVSPNGTKTLCLDIIFWHYCESDLVSKRDKHVVLVTKNQLCPQDMY